MLWKDYRSCSTGKKTSKDNIRSHDCQWSLNFKKNLIKTISFNEMAEKKEVKENKSEIKV